MGVCTPVDIIRHLSHGRKVRWWTFHPFASGRTQGIHNFQKNIDLYPVLQREISHAIWCQTSLGVRKFFLLLNINKPILFVFLATEKTAIILYAMALLKSVFSADASQVTLKLFLSRVNNPRSLALLCWSLNDCYAFLWTLSTFSESHWAMENQSWPSSVTVLICAELCSNYLMIQTCFSFATVLCLHFFFSINRTAGLWQFLPVSWLSTKAILLIFQPTAFEWLAPCLWTCSLFNSKCIILNFFLLNCIRSMSRYFSWSALPSRTIAACRDLSVCDTSRFGFFVACFAFSVDQCISQITLNYTAINKPSPNLSDLKP